MKTEKISITLDLNEEKKTGRIRTLFNGLAMMVLIVFVLEMLSQIVMGTLDPILILPFILLVIVTVILIVMLTVYDFKLLGIIPVITTGLAIVLTIFFPMNPISMISALLSWFITTLVWYFFIAKPIPTRLIEADCVSLNGNLTCNGTFKEFIDE